MRDHINKLKLETFLAPLLPQGAWLFGLRHPIDCMKYGNTHQECAPRSRIPFEVRKCRLNNNLDVSLQIVHPSDLPLFNHAHGDAYDAETKCDALDVLALRGSPLLKDA